MSYSQRVKRSWLVVLAAVIFMVIPATILARLGYHTGYTIAAGGIAAAICLVVLTVARSKVKQGS